MFGDKVLSFIDGREDRIIKIAGILSIACVVAIVLMLIFGNINASTGKTFLSINVAPNDAKIVINGNEYTNGVYEIPAGEYDVEISKENFDSKTEHVKVGYGATTVFYSYITNYEGLDYFRRSAVDINILSHIDEQEVKDFVEHYRWLMAIDNKLPVKKLVDMNSDKKNARINSAEVAVSNGTNDSRCKMAFCLTIRSNGDNKTAITNAAKKMVEDLGYKLEQFEVIYDF